MASKKSGGTSSRGRTNMRFTDNSLKVKAEFDKALVAFLHEASAAIKSQAERFTPVGETSQLKKSWTKHVDEKKMKASIGNSMEYAIYLEMGTGEYALEGNGRKGYWVYVKDNDSGNMAKSSNTYTLEQAKAIVASMRADGLDAYMTKGTRPRRMLYKAMQIWKPKIQARARQIFKSRGF